MTFYRVGITALLTLAILQPGISVARSLNETLDVKPGQQLLLRSDVGRVEVIGHSKSTVMVDVEIVGLDEDELSVEIEKDSAGVSIKGEYARGWHRRWGHSRVRFNVRVPEEFEIDVRTSGGSIRVGNITGRVDAETSGGSMRFEDVTGNISGHTSGGSVSADNVKGDLDLKTSGGSFDIAGVIGNADLKSSGGSIRVEEITGSIKASTSGGGITARFNAPMKQASELETSGGSVTVYLVDGTGIDVDAHTSGGRVRSEFPIDGRVRKNSAFGRINGGGPKLNLESSGGGIRIRKI